MINYLARWYLYFVFYSFAALSIQAQNSLIDFEWDQLPSIPPGQGQEIQPGFAGAFIGIHNDALIIAGGANFPDGPAWEGGQKKYHTQIYVLEKTGEGEFEWFEEKSFDLDQDVGYGITIPTEEGLICVGGMDASKATNRAFILSWDTGKKEIQIDSFPDLPQSMANLTGGKIGDDIYVAGSLNNGEKYFWRLNLSQKTMAWESLPVWDGSPRTHAIGIVQNDGEESSFYLIKGRFKGNRSTSNLHNDAWVYKPSTNEWTELKSDEEFYLSAGTAVPVGANHIFLFGGDDGTVFNQLEQLGTDIQSSDDNILKADLIQKHSTLQINHSGFSRDIWSFHTITQTWTKIGDLPFQPQVTTHALLWDDDIIIPTGEVAPCIRTPDINRVILESKVSFGTMNFVVLLVYLLVLIGIGIYFSRNQHSAEDFFKGGNRIPWWAAGLSIFGTQLSAITFMAIPAKTFATDWLYFFLMMTIIMVAPFVVRFFLPFYRRFNLTTAYEYLELRFNLPTRLLGSIMYILLQLGRLGIVLLLPSLALSVVTGIDVYTCILTMGVLSILYTVLGGIEAVIWTDVVQVIVLLGGALLSLVILYFSIDNGEISNHISGFRKMRIFDFELSLSSPTLWVVLIGGFASNLIQYGSDQTVIQRYLTTKDEKSAAKGIMTGAWLALPSTLIFFSLGTLLFVFYKSNPELLNPILKKNDAIFPWYIVNTLPQGVSGLLIAAVFAASMSSLDSSMNSVSTVITTDFFKRLRPLNTEANYLKLARGITIVIGVLGTLLALLMATWGISSLWDQFNMIVGLFAGGLGGVFILGIFVQRCNGSGALTGLFLSGIIQFFIKEFTNIHLLMYAFTGMFSCIIIGYLVSMVTSDSQEEKLKYTYKGIKSQNQKEL